MTELERMLRRTFRRPKHVAIFEVEGEPTTRKTVGHDADTGLHDLWYVDVDGLPIEGATTEWCRN